MKKITLIISFWAITGVAQAVEWTTQQEPHGRLHCTARTYMKHTVSGTRCLFLDEVMVGIRSTDPWVVECARIDVNCYRAQAESEIKKESNQ